ncbi:MAG: hypothetical protein AAF353_18250 [Pseudomonadota bacterium]
MSVEIGILDVMTETLINFDRYPLHQLDSAAGKKLVRQTRESLLEHGSCLFPDFIPESILQTMREESHTLIPQAYPGPTEVSPYFFNYEIGQGQPLPPEHPIRHKGKRNLAQVAADLIPESHRLRQLYQSDVMLKFLAAVIEQPVYRNMDPYQSLNISVMDRGGCQQWHFDGGNMVTTLLLQEPETGGIFEYVPGIRNDQEENFDEVQQILNGEHKKVKSLQLRAGTLSLFRGHYSLHRVTEVDGKRQRIQAILGYTTRPGWFGSKASSVLHYGPRVAEIEKHRPQYPPQVAPE